LDGMRWIDKGMCQLDKRPHIVIRAYTGSTESRVAHTVGPKDTTAEKESDKQ
jgi:hypothetical protein